MHSHYLSTSFFESKTLLKWFLFSSKDELDELDDGVELRDRFKASDSLEILLKRFLFSSRGELDEPDEELGELPLSRDRFEVSDSLDSLYWSKSRLRTSA